MLTLAIVGVVCRDGTERGWWLGFALFGWGYLLLAFWSSLDLPTTALLHSLQARLNPTIGRGAGGLQSVQFSGVLDRDVGMPPIVPFKQTVHCLFALLAAITGGTASCLLFGGRRKRDEQRDYQSKIGAQAPPLRSWLRPAFLWLLACGLILCLGVPGLYAARSSPEFWVMRDLFRDMRAAGNDRSGRNTWVRKAPASAGRGRTFWRRLHDTDLRSFSESRDVAQSSD